MNKNTGVETLSTEKVYYDVRKQVIVLYGRPIAEQLEACVYLYGRLRKMIFFSSILDRKDRLEMGR